MDIELLIALFALLALILLGVVYLKTAKRKDEKEEVVRQRAPANRAREGVPRRAQILRNRNNVRQRVQAAAEEVEVGDEGENDEGERGVELPEGKIGARKRAKLEAKAEKKAQREVDERLRAEKKKKEAKDEEEAKRLQELEAEQERKQEEEEKRLREEKERKEYEEYMKMKEAFSVEEEGFEENDVDDNENMLQQFVSYIKEQKVVILEDLAAKFKLKTQAVIERIKDLQNDDLITGVIDDRGKFIYISKEEMEAIMKFIKQRGRISIAELAESSHQLIHLTPNC